MRILEDFLKKIWLDLTNSPHVILYNSMIPKMKEAGYDIVITARDYAQTIELLELFSIPYTLIGKHQGKNKIKKILGLLSRSFALYKFAKGKNFDAAISMSSQYIMIAARLRRIPHMTLFDYEYSTGHKISFRLSKKILSPQGVSQEVLKEYGAKMEKVVYYSGLKEQFYIHYYMKKYREMYGASNPIREKFHIDEERVLVVVRPEATVAHYQINKNSLSMELVEFLNNHPIKPFIILLPRINSQREEYKQKNFENVIIPDEVINGIDLVASCDLIIGAGGTMNREGAAVGTPVYTIYQGGKMCAVDRMLIESERMTHVATKHDFSKIKLVKKTKAPHTIGEDLTEMYIKEIEKLIKL